MKEIPVYQTIFNDIYKDILSGIYEEGGMLPPEQELCKKYISSRITVNKALQMLVEKGFIKRIQGKGSFVTAKGDHILVKPRIIGVIICGLSPSFGIRLFKAIENCVRTEGYSVVYKDSRYDSAMESQCIAECIALGVDGIILHPVHAERFNEELLKAAIAHFPIVLVDRDISGLSFSFVGSDNHYNTKQAVKYLFDKGHRNICFMSSDPKYISTIEGRINAFNEAFIDNNILNTSVNLFTSIKSTRLVRADRKQLDEDINNICAHLNNNPQITCVFASEHSIYLLVKEAVKRMGKSIPDDISLLTYDDIVDDFSSASVSHIRQNEEEIGQKAVQLVVEAIQGKPATKLYLSTELIIDGSIKDISNR